MSAGLIPFSAQAKTLPISVTDTASTSTALPSVGNTIRCVNEGTNACFISVGTGTQTATLPNATPTATSTPVLPGEDAVFSIPDVKATNNANSSLTAPTPLNISAICRSGLTTTLLVQVGEGV